LPIIAVSFFSLASCQSEKEVDKESAGRTTPVPMSDPSRLKDSGGAEGAVEDRLKRWDELAAMLQGEGALAAREALISEALNSLEGPICAMAKNAAITERLAPTARSHRRIEAG
jgi:hypothetical protein